MTIVLLLFQMYVELDFLKFAKKHFGFKMLSFSLLGIHVINLGIILGVFYYIIKKFITKSV